MVCREVLPESLHYDGEASFVHVQGREGVHRSGEVRNADVLYQRKFEILIGLIIEAAV